MSTMQIQERFTVAAPPDRVWRFLVDPSRVVTCLPGAALTESSEDGRTHSGTVTVKAGPITVSYKGTAEFAEVDDEGRYLRMEAKGQEKVSMTMESRVQEHESGTEVVVDADVKLTGKLVSFGRGMMDAVAQEILKDFTGCLSGKLEGEGGAEAPGAPSGEGGTADAPGAARAGEGGRAPATGARAAESTPGEAAPASGLGLLFRALRRWLRGLFGGS